MSQRSLKLSKLKRILLWSACWHQTHLLHCDGQSVVGQLIGEKKLLSWAHVGGGCSWLREGGCLWKAHLSFLHFMSSYNVVALRGKLLRWWELQLGHFLPWEIRINELLLQCASVSKWGQEHLSISQLLHRMCCDVTGSNAGDNTSASNYKAWSSQQTKRL